MFVHKEQLEYALRPEDYASPEAHHAEIDSLFLRTWHPVCLAGDLPQVGDFLTIELAGQPLLLRHTAEGLRGYLNICSHRHCLLTDARRGHAAGITCQYHGWEYGTDGRVSKVPDGGCFKPFDRENARLETVPVATCGQLVFVRLAAEGPTLAEHLGGWTDRVARSFSSPYRCNWRYEAEFACNWKIPVENTVETYHLPSVHPTTLGGFGMIPEQAQKHYLENRSTTLIFNMGRETPLMKRQRRVVSWLGGGTDTAEYVHHHVFPNLVFTFADLYTYCQVYLPVGPTTSVTRSWMFSLDGTRSNPFARVMARLVARHGVRANAAIQREDATVFAAVQRGLAATPFRGCLGTREERIWCFHRHVLAGRDRDTRPQRP
ncbi:MAG: aromatic ring-hydroxylating dioxygenase subunit alpha [Planctomycetes bacterium]|nr:aromatic ring-hydroxylating dioxygenase subunit alpha [Planctomycetota bacterium]